MAARPYDVLTSDEARAEAAGNPLSFLHVSKAEIDLEPGTDAYDERVYRKAAENFRHLVSDGILVQESEPRLYLYAQTLNDHTQCGIAACVTVREYLNGTIRRHELTRRDKEDDRTRHIEAVRAHSGPVMLAYRATATIDLLVAEIRQNTPACDFTADDGVRHRLWVIGDTRRVKSITDTFTHVDRLYIADGHHRAAAAARVAQQSAAPGAGGEEQYFLAVLFPHDQLRIMPYNRVVRDLHGLDVAEFIREVGQRFRMEKTSPGRQPSRKGEFGMYLQGQWYTLTTEASSRNGADAVERLDVSILQNRLLEPLLGILDPRSDERIDFVGGVRGPGELERRVNEGSAAVAFDLYPTSMEELLAVADAGVIMPPKSTWFEPKMRDGVVVHTLE